MIPVVRATGSVGAEIVLLLDLVRSMFRDDASLTRAPGRLVAPC